MGLKIVEKMYENGFDSIVKVLTVTKEQLEIDGFKEKSSTNLINSIKKSVTDKPLELIMKASNKLGRGMGEGKSKIGIK